jgi:hypothetical protein
LNHNPVIFKRLPVAVDDKIWINILENCICDVIPCFIAEDEWFEVPLRTGDLVANTDIKGNAGIRFAKSSGP